MKYVIATLIVAMAVTIAALAWHRSAVRSKYHHWESSDGMQYSDLVDLDIGEVKFRTSWRENDDDTISILQTGPLRADRRHGEWFVIRDGKLERRWYWDSELVLRQEWFNRNGKLLGAHGAE